MSVFERDGMQKGSLFVKKRWRPFLGIVFAVLTANFLLCVIVNDFSPFSTEGVSILVVIGTGMSMTALGCLTVFFYADRLVDRAENPVQTTGADSGGNTKNEAHPEGEDEGNELSLSGPDHRLEERILLSTVIEQTEDNVLITDSHRTILYINPAFERSSGYACSELKGRPMRYLRSDQHDKTFFQRMKDTLDQGETWVGVIINKGKNGADFEIEGNISPIKDSSGKITHWVAVGRNMSRFRKLERELQRVQKMDALGTLAGGIAHDFNNILAAVMGLVEMEYLEADNGSRTRIRMEQALGACGRARDLVKQILAFSSRGVQRRRPLKVSAVIEDALQMLRATLPATITIQPNLDAKDSLILGDSIQLHQVIVNLCTNAAHAMRRSGGVLGIGLKNVEFDDTQAFVHPELRSGAYLLLTVSDTGEGMDQSVRERIFEPFFSTKSTGEGVGVGLSVVHGIVKSHGGKIIVRSEPDKGSVFDIFFPRIEGMEELPEHFQEPVPGLGNERIMVVDDEKLVVAVASEMLHALGYQVVPVQRSVDALEIFRSQPDSFHLVLTDQTMPRMTGMELAAELHKIRADIPIILCSGYSDENVSKKAWELGIRKILSKPFVMQELASSVREILDFKEQ